MAVLFEPSHPPFWCQTRSLPYLNVSPPPSPFYNIPIHFMSGPTRTESSNHRANPLLASHNPPRPPNAWILYRSDKLKELPPPPPGMPRRPQADISKTISAMWKSEPSNVRAEYERRSDIKKAEHQAMYPDYRFQPMKKAEKDRLRAEKLAEKERERGTRKTKARTRVGVGKEPPPLFTTEARFGPAGPSPPASGASTPPVGTSSMQASASQPTPPSGHPTPPSDRPHTPFPPSPYPPPPSTSTIPPLVAPQPGVPQRPPSASGWPAQTSEQQQQLSSLWMSQGALPDMSEYAGSQEYLTIPLPAHQPLGWSPDDPSPSTDLPFYQPDPLHAVLSATDDPNVFDLGSLDWDFFDGSREIEVSMGSNLPPAAFGDMSQFSAFSSLFAGWDDASSTANSSQQHPFDQRVTSLEGLGAYSFDSLVDENACEEPEYTSTSTPEAQRPVTPTPTHEIAPAPTPYMPPAGAANSSTRRVAADWRHIRLTPEPETPGEVWSGHGR